jgi:hypothetical protein
LHLTGRIRGMRASQAVGRAVGCLRRARPPVVASCCTAAGR